MSIGRTGPRGHRRRRVRRRRCDTPSARASSSPSPPATSSRTATRRRSSPRSRRGCTGAVSVAAVDRAKSARLLLDHRQLRRARGAGRIGPRLRQRRAASASRRSTSTSPTRSCCRRRSSARRGSTCFGYIGYIGTSMATPHVAGVAAMLMQQGITDPAAIEEALEKFADRSRHAGPRRHVRLRPGRCARGAARTGAGQVKTRTLAAAVRCLATLAAARRARRIPPAVVASARSSWATAAGVHRQRDLRRGLREDARAVLRRRRAGRRARSVRRRGRRLALQADRRARVPQRRGRIFRLGIPLTATITPLEITGGYRFPLSERALARTWRRASARTRYKETSDFADPAENVDTRQSGFVVNGGVEFRLHRWVGVGATCSTHACKGILGEGGVSQQVGEDDLGGVAARFKFIVGR